MSLIVWAFFQALFFKIGIALGGRALACALWKFCLPGGLALAIALLLKAVFTFEDMPLWMFPSGAGSEPSVNQGPPLWRYLPSLWKELQVRLELAEWHFRSPLARRVKLRVLL